MYALLPEITVDQPWALALALLALVPLLVRGFAAFSYPAVVRLPQDVLSIWLERLWRILGALAIVAAALGLAGIHGDENQVERLGKGAHVMIVLDRSASMNENFGDSGAGDGISKMEEARKVLGEFIQQGREDLLGMVTFSTSPILVAPLGGDREAVQAGLRATAAGGMGFTAIARGLGMALDYFENKPVTGARALLLVSDGGAHLDVKTQDMLRSMFQRQEASLYWIYLRTANSGSLEEAPDEQDSGSYPEYNLHKFFGTLGVPYHAYEAENPGAVEKAMADIARLKNQPVRYYEAAPRFDYSGIFYLLALICAGGLFALRLTEVTRWRAA